jgi:hypothetical protein
MSMEGGGLTDWLSRLSLLEVALTTFAAMLLSAIAGNFAGRFRLARSGGEADDLASQDGPLVGGTLGLLALLLAFSFAMVLNRYETRRELVTQEANAIGTAYLRVQLLDEPHRSRLSQLLVAYADNRIELANGADVSRRLQVNDALLTAIWAAVTASRESALAHGITTPLMLTFNDLIDRDTDRKVARQLQFPPEVLKLLLISLVAAAAVVGHSVPTGRTWPCALVLFAVLALSVSVITDLNRPTSGLERESQLAMIMQLQAMRNSPPTIYDRFRSPPPRAQGAVE